jgi:hypothetical protein
VGSCAYATKTWRSKPQREQHQHANSKDEMCVSMRQRMKMLSDLAQRVAVRPQQALDGRLRHPCYGRRAQVRANDAPVLEDVILVDKIQNKTNKTHPPSFALVAKLAVLSLYWQVIVFVQPHHHRSMCHIDDETPRLEFFLIAHLDKPIKRLQRRPCTRYRRRSALHAVLTCSERGDHSVCVSEAQNRATTQLSLRGMAHMQQPVRAHDMQPAATRPRTTQP